MNTPDFAQNKKNKNDLKTKKDNTKQAEICGNLKVNYYNRIYNTVQIGTQCWLKENLDVGTMIKGNQNSIKNGMIEKYCYDNKTENCDKYGGLYQWNEAMEYSTKPGAKGICPEGFHIPTQAEFETLAKSSVSDFSEFDAGIRDNNGYFKYLGTWTHFWSSTKVDSNNPYFMYKDPLNGSINIYFEYKSNGFSVRCLKD
jgi:hypothetical protein